MVENILWLTASFAPDGRKPVPIGQVREIRTVPGDWPQTMVVSDDHASLGGVELMARGVLSVVHERPAGADGLRRVVRERDRCEFIGVEVDHQSATWTSYFYPET